MRIRKLTLLAALALVVASCAGGEADETTTSGAAPTAAPETTTTTQAAAPEAIELSYTLEAGQTFTYEVDMDQTISMSIDGDASALAESEDEEVPEEMDVNINGTTTFTYSVADGPEPGTYEITITGDFSDLSFSGTVDGQPITPDGSEIPDLAEIEPIDVTIIVDEQGNIVTDGSGLGEDLFGGLGGLDMLDQFGPGTGTGQFVGPPFSEEEVTVGDTWTETIEIPTLPEDDPITTTVESEVVTVEELNGVEVFVIETTTSTSAIEFDLAQLLIGFMTAFVPEDASEEDLAELDALIEELRFAFSIDPMTADMTTWFDFEAGLARQAEVTSSTRMVMDINVPDETTGELVEMALDMTIDQDLSYRLIDSSEA